MSYNQSVRQARQIAAGILIIWVLFMFVSPFLPAPLTALRAQQLAAAFYFGLAAAAAVLLALLHTLQLSIRLVTHDSLPNHTAPLLASSFLRC